MGSKPLLVDDYRALPKIWGIMIIISRTSPATSHLPPPPASLHRAAALGPSGPAPGAAAARTSGTTAMETGKKTGKTHGKAGNFDENSRKSWQIPWKLRRKSWMEFCFRNNKMWRWKTWNKIYDEHWWTSKNHQNHTCHEAVPWSFRNDLTGQEWAIGMHGLGIKICDVWPSWFNMSFSRPPKHMKVT